MKNFRIKTDRESPWKGPGKLTRLLHEEGVQVGFEWMGTTPWTTLPPGVTVADHAPETSHVLLKLGNRYAWLDPKGFPPYRVYLNEDCVSFEIVIRFFKDFKLGTTPELAVFLQYETEDGETVVFRTEPNEFTQDKPEDPSPGVRLVQPGFGGHPPLNLGFVSCDGGDTSTGAGAGAGKGAGAGAEVVAVVHRTIEGPTDTKPPAPPLGRSPSHRKRPRMGGALATQASDDDAAGTGTRTGGGAGAGATVGVGVACDAAAAVPAEPPPGKRGKLAADTVAPPPWEVPPIHAIMSLLDPRVESQNVGHPRSQSPDGRRS